MDLYGIRNLFALDYILFRPFCSLICQPHTASDQAALHQLRPEWEGSGVSITFWVSHSKSEGFYNHSMCSPAFHISGEALLFTHLQVFTLKS